MTSLVEAAQAFSDSRLPEVFAGYEREAGPFPVQYPTASSPQAWACGSTMLMLRAALGLEPDPAGGGMTLDPHLPGILSDLRIGGISAFGRRFEVQVQGDRAEALPAD
jgi:glycogen debranching enzyme